MTHLALMVELSAFKGRAVTNCFREINEIARDHKLTVNVMDPMFNTGSIDEEPRRLNVRTDKDGIIKSFTLG